MTNNSPYWYKLISYWVKQKRREGLTIPFLIGAEKYLNNDKTIEPKSVAELINEVINSDIQEGITIFYCDTIGEYVLGLNNHVYSMSGQEIKNEVTNKTTLIATSSTLVLGKNIQEIVKSLTSKYSKCLHDKKYSLVNLQWTDFNEADKKMINEALA